MAFWLAHVHPIWMLVSLAMGFLTLRAGLALRTARRTGVRKNAADYKRHLRFAKPTMGMLWVGFAAGLASAVFLRGWDAFGSLHGLTSTVVLVGFSATAVLGRQHETGARKDPEFHGILGLVSMLGAALAFGTGFVLLP